MFCKSVSFWVDQGGTEGRAVPGFDVDLTGFLPGVIFVTQVFIRLSSVAGALKASLPTPRVITPQSHRATLRGHCLCSPPSPISSSDIHMAHISKPSPVPNSTHTQLLHCGETCGSAAKIAGEN